jgi:hypothetical protein
VRGVTAVLVLLLAACSTAGGDTTTTTAPLTEPSTTTTAPATTTTTERTTTTVEECTERNGVLRNRRGFVCPPWLIPLDFVGIGTGQTAIHLPGTYDTRQFIPRFRFTREEQFTTVGERTQSVAFDYPPNMAMEAFGGEGALELARLPELQPVGRPDDWIWVEELETGEIEVGGSPAMVTSFTANCLDETSVNPDACLFDIPALGNGIWTQLHGQRTAVIVVDTPDPMTIVVEADDRSFDTYWAEVAQPILDSIEFLDP